MLKNRDCYMKTLMEFKDKQVIKIVTGMRRCGKSSLLLLFAQKLLELGVPSERIIKMNFESMSFDSIRDYRDLYSNITSQLPKEGKVYLILDEVQMVERWEKAINAVSVDCDADIYITGSNAYLLSSELSTLLSGRFVEIKMLPLSFREYIDFNNFDAGVSHDEQFESFLKFGGMPAVSEYGFNQNRINDMLDGIFSTVILKDVMARNTVTDENLMGKIVRFMADNIGNPSSPNSTANFLASGREIHKNDKVPANRTVSTYMDMLEKAYIFYKLNRFDIKGKEYLKTQAKYYIVDTGIRNMLLGYRDADRGHILENVVCLELLRRGYRLSIGKVGDKEIDFIAENQDSRVYIQVAETLRGAETLKRELASLAAVSDNHEKMIITSDHSFIKSENGIKLVNIIDFLLE